MIRIFKRYFPEFEFVGDDVEAKFVAFGDEFLDGVDVVFLAFLFGFGGFHGFVWQQGQLW